MSQKQQSQGERKNNNNFGNRSHQYYKKERKDFGENKGDFDRAGKPNQKKVKKNLLDDSKEQAELKALIDKKNAEQQKIKDVEAKIQALSNPRKNNQNNNNGEGPSRKKELLNKKKQLNQERNEIQNQKEILSAQLHATVNKLPLTRKKDQSVEDFATANLSEIDRQIADIEKQIQNGTNSLAEEKRKINELERVKKSKKDVEEYKRKAVELDQVYANLKANGAEFKIVKTELDDIFAAEKEQNEEYEKNKKSNEERQEQYRLLIEEKRAINENFAKLRSDIKDKRQEIDGKWADWKAEQAVLQEKRREEYAQQKIEKEKQRQEWKEAKIKKQQEEEEQRKKEEEAKLPFVDDIARLDALIAYTSGLRVNKNKPNMQIKHSIDSYFQFEEASVPVPTVVKDIEAAKTALQQKKDHFLELQRAEVVKREELKKQQADQQRDLVIAEGEANKEVSVEEVKAE